MISGEMYGSPLIPIPHTPKPPEELNYQPYPDEDIVKYAK
jgi:hypothetical protein